MNSFNYWNHSLYGFSEDRDFCRRALRNHLEENLGMETCVSDAAVFLKKSDKNLSDYAKHTLMTMFMHEMNNTLKYVNKQKTNST